MTCNFFYLKMDSYMKCYFEDIFAKMDRDSLSQRYKRQELVQYFDSVIAGCSKGEEKSDQSVCRNFVRLVLHYHNEYKRQNGEVCLMGKYHNMLYVAMKLSFDWSLQNNEIVASLLDEIYACEKTFERIFLGAIFGASAPHFLSGWKSDFTDKEENVHALVFFLDHATNANLEFKDGDKTFRFIDVPLESCGKSSPVRVVIQLGAAEMLMILLRFGARITFDNTSTNPIETILDKLNEYNRKYPYELVTCIKLILRAIPRVVFTVDRKVCNQLGLPEDYNCQRMAALEKYGDIIEDRLIPTTRCGLSPVELRHLCRCSIRERLWENFQLPFGIQQLPIPKSLQKYLDLFTD